MLQYYPKNNGDIFKIKQAHCQYRTRLISHAWPFGINVFRVTWSMVHGPWLLKAPLIEKRYGFSWIGIINHEWRLICERIRWWLNCILCLKGFSDNTVMESLQNSSAPNEPCSLRYTPRIHMSSGCTRSVGTPPPWSTRQRNAFCSWTRAELQQTGLCVRNWLLVWTHGRLDYQGHLPIDIIGINTIFSTNILVWFIVSHCRFTSEWQLVRPCAFVHSERMALSNENHKWCSSFQMGSM